MNLCSKIGLPLVQFRGVSNAIICRSTINKNDSKVGGDMHILHGGGNSRAIRRICVISVALAEPPADTKCQFRGFSPRSRRSFQRKYCKFCNKCSNNCNIYHILNIRLPIIYQSVIHTVKHRLDLRKQPGSLDKSQRTRQCPVKSWWLITHLKTEPRL